MNKHELKSLLENIYTALTEAEYSPHMTPEGPGGEPIQWEYKPEPKDGPSDPSYIPTVYPPHPIEPPLKPGEFWHWDDTLGEWVIRPTRSWFDQTFPGFDRTIQRVTPFW